MLYIKRHKQAREEADETTRKADKTSQKRKVIIITTITISVGE